MTESCTYYTEFTEKNNIEIEKGNVAGRNRHGLGRVPKKFGQRCDNWRIDVNFCDFSLLYPFSASFCMIK